jgi:DNA-binding transcriptional ArsR family regulator
MPTRDNDRVVLSDPRAIRALAHPARLAIIESLAPGEELTATELAAVTGLSPSATSYHLKALAKWGIVEAGEARADGRDRPWKATGRTVEVSSQVPGSTTVAEIAILGTFLDRNRAIATEFLEHQASEPPEWRDEAALASHDYWLTADELARVNQAVRDALAPYEQRGRDSRPANSRRVRIARLVVPRGSISPGSAPPDPPMAERPRGPVTAPWPGDPGQRDGTAGG